MEALTSVAIVGASGYTGAELIRLLLGHPRVTIARVCARRAAGQTLAAVFPHLTGCLDAPIVGFDADDVAAAADVAFVALPHGEAAPVVAALRARGVITLDLSADFRLRDAATWAAWYGGGDHPTHPAPALLADAVYGLPERHRAACAAPGLVAVPGCYPTATTLAIAPLLERRAGQAPRGLDRRRQERRVGGRAARPGWPPTCPRSAEGLRPYKVGGSHRHTPEIEQELALAAGAPVSHGVHAAPGADERAASWPASTPIRPTPRAARPTTARRSSPPTPTSRSSTCCPPASSPTPPTCAARTAATCRWSTIAAAARCWR
jgi:N-acetyl-gamma-glutamyl-phosphate reductase